MTIEQQCAFIKEQGVLITTHQLKKSFDAIIAELNKLTPASSINAIKQILLSIHIDNVKSYGEPDIADHQLFITIRDCYLEILRRWRGGQVLDKSSYEVFLKISILFDLMCAHVTDDNVNQFKKLLIHQPLLDEFNGCLTEIATTGKHLQDPQIKAVDLMIRAIHRIFQGRIKIQNDSLLMPLLDAIVNCVCSPFFASIFEQVTEINELNEAQTLLLDTCPNCFSWYGGDRREEFCTVIRTVLLSSFTRLLMNHISSCRQWNKVMLNAVKKSGNIILDFDTQHSMIYSKEIYKDCYQVIDCFVSILSSSMSTPTEKTDSEMTGVVVLQLYLLTLDYDLLSYIKSKQLASVLLKLVNVANEWVQFNAYRILACILTKQDIKGLANPSAISNVFLTFLTNVIDDPSKVLRLRSLLRCLTSKGNFFQFIKKIFSTK